ncbi:MAG: O-antigen ligase family protein [Helicobacter sp.]|nr:O-antigen ligase family protein [Helicobacter sp.]
MMRFLEKYYQKVVVGLFCVGIILYGLGLSKTLIPTQTLFDIIGVLTLFYVYRRFSLYDITQIRYIVLCLAIVLVCALLTIFDTRLGFSISEKLKTINTHTISPILFFLIAYLYALYASERSIRFLFFVFAFAALACVGSTLYLWFESGFQAQLITPWYFDYVVMPNVWLLGASAVCIVGCVYAKSYVRFLSILGLCLCGMAIVANGERSFLLAFLGMCVCSVFVLRYRYKIYITSSLLVALVPLCYGVYLYTASLSDRYNFAHLLDNILVVWDTKPIEMGQFDVGCFAQHAMCSKESLAKGKNNISIEHSSLARIAMYKSALHLIMHEPFRPHIIGSWNIGPYLYAFYDAHDPYRVYLDTSVTRLGIDLYGYPHIHSTPISLSIEYGVCGFLAIAIFVFLIAFRGFMASKQYRFLGSVVVLLIIGMCIQTQFDVMYSVNLRVLMLFFGLFIGYMLARDREAHTTL